MRCDKKKDELRAVKTITSATVFLPCRLCSTFEETIVDSIRCIDCNYDHFCTECRSTPPGRVI